MSKPFLSVVTRTKNREIMLSRLMNHLLRQSFKDFEWVIVNDAGSISGVKIIQVNAIQSGMKVTLVDNVVSNGRSAAANIGVKKAIGKYVIILDDDDFPRDEYFANVHNFLTNNPRYSGVACWAEVILEQLKDDKIINCGVECTYSPVPNDLSILSLHTLNIPPCSLVLDRDIFIQVGGYPEDIDCTEDWAFICNFIMKADVGVIPNVLVNYSKRINPEGDYKNTTSDKVGMFRHQSDEVVWRNARVRASVEQNNIVGLIPILGSMNMKSQDIRVTLHKFEVMQDEIKLLNDKNNEITNELNKLLNSRSWKITKPLRFIMKLFK